MEFLQKNARAIIIALLAVGVIVAISASGDTNSDDATKQDTSQVAEQDEATEEAQEDNKDTTEGTETIEEEATEPVTDSEGDRNKAEVATSDESYKVVARSGDNQTVLVRDIIEQYIQETSVELSAEQKLFTETNLVILLPKDDLIAVGEEVTLTKEQAKTLVNQAKELDEATLALWASYL